MGRPELLKLRTLLLIVIQGVALTGSDVTYCPRSLYDCDSLETGLLASGDVIITPEFIASIGDESYMSEICRFFKSPKCYEPVVSQCKGELVYATRAFRSKQRYICGDRFARKGTDNFSLCVAQIEPHSHRCLEKRAQRLEKIAHVTKTSSSHTWCNLTDDYITCVYSIMALACTMDEAEEYMKNMKQLTPVMDAIYGHSCSFEHPLNILKTTTAPPETTQDLYADGGRGVIYRSGRHPSVGSRRSSGSSVHVYSRRNPRRDAAPPNKNKCNAFFPLCRDGWSLSLFINCWLICPGQSLIVLCCLVVFCIQTFLVRASCAVHSGNNGRQISTGKRPTLPYCSYQMVDSTVRKR